MAINMDTGKVLWSAQDTVNDIWLAGCGPQNTAENCPTGIGRLDPSMTLAPPILRTLTNGHRILVARQKDGIYGHTIRMDKARSSRKSRSSINCCEA